MGCLDCLNCLRDTQEERETNPQYMTVLLMLGHPQRQTGECTKGLISQTRPQCEIYTEVARMGTLEPDGINREIINNKLCRGREGIQGRSKG